MSDITQVVKDGLNDVQAEVSSWQKSNDRALDALRDEVTELAQKQHVHPMAGKSFSTGPGGFGGTKSVSGQVLDSPAMKAMQGREARGASIPLTMGIKSLVGDTPAGGDTGFPVQPQRHAGFANDARRRLSLLDTLTSIKVNSGSFEFASLDGFTNASAYQSKQGGKKATQALGFELKTANIATIAALLPMSEQVLADAPGLGMFVQSKMTHAALDKLEAELIGGAGGTGEITGLKSQATGFEADAGTEVPDAIGQAIAQLEANGWNAGAVVMNPNDWQTIRAERATDGQYVAGGWADGAAPSVWGVPVVTSSSMAAGEILLMDTAQVALLDRENPRFEFGYVDAGFAENVINARLELRAGLAVFATSAVLSVTVAA